MLYSTIRNCTQLLLDMIKYVKCRAGLFSLFHTVLRNHLLFQNSSVKICVLMDFLNVQPTFPMWVRDRSNVSTNCITYKVVSKVQACVYWNSNQ